MFRRIVLAFTFVAALGAAGVGMASKAEAHGCGYGGGYANYYGYRNVYYSGYPNAYTPYYAGYGYQPVVVYPGGGHRHRHHHHHDYYRGGSGVTFAIGF